MSTPASSTDARPWPAFAVAGALWGLALPLILTGNMNGRGAYDQMNFHEKAVRAFAAELPRPDLSDYLSATTPGYHLLLAAFARAGLDSATALRLVSAAIGVGFVLTLGLWAARRMRPWEALGACLPLALSLYTVQSAAWMLPDNAGWWGVLIVLLLALRPKVDARFFVWGGAALLLLVLVRQIHIWAAAPLWAAAWLGSRDQGGRLLGDLRRRFPRAVAAGLATLPAFAALGAFVWLWGALTPPSFQNYYPGLLETLRRGNPLDKAPLAAPAFILSLLGIGSCFFGAYFAGPLLDLARRRAWIPILAGAAGALAALVPATTYSKDGRWSGIWNAGKYLPELAGRTAPHIVVLSTIGAVCLVGWVLVLGRRERWIVLASLAAFTLAQAGSAHLAQRYSEPFMLIVLPIMAALSTAPRPALIRPLRIAGPLALAALLSVVTLGKIATDHPAIRRDWNPASTSTAPME